VRRRIWLELLGQLGTEEPTEQQRRLMIRICDLEVEVALQHMHLSRGKLDASGLRLLTALSASLRATRAELFAPPRAVPKPQPAPKPVVEAKPAPVPKPELGDYLARKGREKAAKDGTGP
jgi:hypothetical protein